MGTPGRGSDRFHFPPLTGGRILEGVNVALGVSGSIAAVKVVELAPELRRHGAQVAITLIHDADVPYYHDWVAPEGYFTDRDREVPPGCEEIDETERRARERESMAAMREYFADPHPERQRTHPSLTDDPDNRLPEDDED